MDETTLKDGDSKQEGWSEEPYCLETLLCAAYKLEVARNEEKHSEKKPLTIQSLYFDLLKLNRDTDYKNREMQVFMASLVKGKADKELLELLQSAHRIRKLIEKLKDRPPVVPDGDPPAKTIH